jgi:hypothetical protein
MTCDTVGLGRAGWGSSILVIIFGLDRVGSYLFFSSGENFDLCPIRHMVGSGRVGFFRRVV